MEFRKIFDTIPEQFDKYRPRYSKELFDSLIDYAKIGPGKSGSCDSEPKIENGKLRFYEKWKWTNGESGTSIIEEI